MREIKFRAWDKTVNKMSKVIRITYSDVQHTTVNYQYINDKGKKRDDLSLLDDDGHGTIVLMQYTGLKDKNGKEIYEGDIVKVFDRYENRQFTGCVIYEDGTYFIDVMSEDERECVWCDYETEITGNIFENPELLESVE